MNVRGGPAPTYHELMAARVVSQLQEAEAARLQSLIDRWRDTLIALHGAFGVAVIFGGGIELSGLPKFWKIAYIVLLASWAAVSLTAITLISVTANGIPGSKRTIADDTLRELARHSVHQSNRKRVALYVSVALGIVATGLGTAAGIVAISAHALGS